jgi:hypothetical protein
MESLPEADVDDWLSTTLSLFVPSYKKSGVVGCVTVIAI